MVDAVDSLRAATNGAAATTVNGGLDPVTARGRPRCQALNQRGRRPGQQCSRSAIGASGRCGLHGGALEVLPPKTFARYPALQARYEYYLRKSTPELFDLREIAAELREIADWSANFEVGREADYLKLRVATLLHTLDGLERVVRVGERERDIDAEVRTQAAACEAALVTGLEQVLVSFVPTDRWREAIAMVRTSVAALPASKADNPKGHR